MKGGQVLIDRINGRLAAARLIDGVLDDLLIDPPEDRPRPGTIYRARLGRSMKGQGARLVRLPEGTGFLRQMPGKPSGHPDGATLLVQVTGFAEPGKAVPVTGNILFKSRYCIVTPDRPGLNLSRGIRDEQTRLRLRDAMAGLAIPGGMGVILRSAAALADDDAVSADLGETLALAEAVLADISGEPEKLVDGPAPDRLAWRDWSDIADIAVDTREGAFGASGVLEAIDALRQGVAPLPGGGTFWVEPTRALIAVDVNTGGDTSLAAGLKANIDTARALPRALRLRGLGGQIVVDFAPMPKKDRRRLEEALRSAFRGCPVDTSLVGWTPLGHFELNRKRERLSLEDAGI